MLFLRADVNLKAVNVLHIEALIIKASVIMTIKAASTTDIRDADNITVLKRIRVILTKN